MAEIPNSCKPGYCNKSPQEVANCRIICEFREKDQLPQLACWNGGKGFGGLLGGGFNLDTATWNKLRTQHRSPFLQGKIVR